MPHRQAVMEEVEIRVVQVTAQPGLEPLRVVGLGIWRAHMLAGAEFLVVG